MAKTKCVFARNEKKFLISPQQLSKLLAGISSYIKKDEYGSYTVYNIYCDTENDLLIRNSLEKPSYKEKLRLRSYGEINDEDMAFLEIKKKFDGVVYKRRIELPLYQAMAYLEKGIKPKEAAGQIFKEIDYFINFYKVRPKLFIAYDRVAFTGVFDKELRITIDKDIRSRSQELTLKKSMAKNKSIMENQYLMEIKINGAFPLWLAAQLNDMQIFPVSFSKYGKIYTDNLQEAITYKNAIGAAENTQKNIDKLADNSFAAFNLESQSGRWNKRSDKECLQVY